MDEARVREALRYMGARAGDAEAERMAREAWQTLERDVTPRLALRRARVTRGTDGEPSLDGVRLSGRLIERALAECEQAYIIAATLGAQTDLIIRRQSARSIAMGLACSGAASAYLEAFLDTECARLADDARASNLHAQTRVSPGYGDFPLETQRDLLTLADGRRIGLTLTSGGMLAPEKSVIALMGLGSAPAQARPKRCADCDLPNCRHREVERS